MESCYVKRSGTTEGGISLSIWRRALLYGLFGFTAISGIYAFLSTLNDATRDETGAIVSEGELNVFSLELGDCLTELELEESADESEVSEISAARGTSCSESHVYEVFHQETFPDLSQSAILEVAELTCFENFENYVGVPYENSPFYVTYSFPTVDSYARGDRKVQCLLHNERETAKVGSARNSGTESGTFVKDDTSANALFEVGECIADLDINQELAFGGRNVDCSDAHIYEVFYKQSFGDLSQAEIETRAETVCQSEFEDYVGIPYKDSNFYSTYLHPTVTTYATGDRTVICLLHNEAESTIFGTARDSAVNEGSDSSQDVQGQTVFKVGDCLTELNLAELFRYGDTLVDCSNAHVYEVYYSNEFPEFSFESFESDADSICLSQFEDYVGIDYDSSSLYSTTILPSIVSYQDGDREVACLLHNEGETNTYGTARDSGA